MTTERKLFKDWFDRDAAKKMAAQIKGAWKSFDERKFLKLSTRGLDGLEFHGRINQFSQALRQTLPESIPQALNIIIRSLPSRQSDHHVISDGWRQWPLGQFIADYGVAHFEESMEAMLQLTQNFTAEYAVRPFVETYPEQTFGQLLQWTDHPSSHVRRWCSEGTRPRLPWGRKLNTLASDPSPIWPILEKLKDDPAEYVRRSVANNLNDISKDHPHLVIECCSKWRTGASSERLRLINRALRSLIKEGHPEALAIMGFGTPVGIKAALTTKPKKITMGETVDCFASISNQSKKKQNLAIDYAVHFVRQKGKTGIKVFKWKTLTIEPNEEVVLFKKHPMRPATVRALYPGQHRIEIQVNGKVLGQSQFTLI